MYLLGPRSHTSSLTTRIRTTIGARPTTLPYVPRQPRFSYAREYRRPYSNPAGESNERQHGASRSSIKPLTVFAICIPLGCALKWALNEDEATTSSSANGFVKYKLAKKEDISSTSSIFTLKPGQSSTIRTDDPATKRAITSAQFKQPQLQIARNYTLLPSIDGQDPQVLRFLIRKERNGEVSGYLHRLSVGSDIEVRGLSAEYILPEQVNTALFLAGGTGIAPAMQVADALAGGSHVHILWANRRREDCRGGVSDTARPTGWNWDFSGWWSPFGLPSSGIGMKDDVRPADASAIVSQLDSLKSRSARESSKQRQTLVDYYVDEEGTLIQPSEILPLLKSAEKAADEYERGKKLLFVSGPEGFINHWAGPKQWVNGREVQGPLGGVLSTIDLHDWEVVKL
ncbi:hypothetical protein LTR37_015867 [Vermiconidia calcicola]|uniref:Uncharacterized protein n=1 Tax=Vermiconidia calcicola TaxID=1690605 RepID=A0ACC3MR44_9PEZI|nr:hypothetical protein LTR37_015867 [Vermiconidia calcicola]